MNCYNFQMNQTEKLFYNYTSAGPFEAEILELRPFGNDKTAVFLDKTIFYPEGGGQPADRGSINSVPLLDVQEKDGEICHLVSAPDAEQLTTGKAQLLLDARRRRDFTTLHTGQHILSATLLRMLDAPTVSMHLGDETFTIDVDIPEISDANLTAVEDAVANVIEENRPVIVHLCPPEDLNSFPLRKFPPQGEDVIRVVEVSGCDLIACCGTHVKTTAEIGLFRILSAEKYKGMTRISFTAGRRLFLESRSLRQNAVFISRALSIPVSEIGKGVTELLEKSAKMEKRLKIFEEKAIQEKAQALLSKAALLDTAASSGANPRIVIESYAEESIDEVMSIGKAAGKQIEAALILASQQDHKFIAACSVKGFDIRAFIKSAFEAQGGRGGGSPSFFQGSFQTKEALDAFLREINH